MVWGLMKNMVHASNGMMSISSKHSNCHLFGEIKIFPVIAIGTMDSDGTLAAFAVSLQLDCNCNTLL